MGIPPIIVYGDDCNNGCFDPGETPLNLAFSVNGMLKGFDWRPHDPAPPNISGIMVQTDLLPCVWSVIIGLFAFEINAGPVAARMFISYTPGPDLVFSGVTGHCDGDFKNDIFNPNNNHYYSGFVQVWTV